MIEARSLTKRYGDKVAVDDLSFSIKPGRVTGFLGPNGAGKTTTMRMILGLDRPSAGAVTVNGKPFAGLYSPMREVGALLDAKAMQGHARPILLPAQRPCPSGNECHNPVSGLPAPFGPTKPVTRPGRHRT